MHAGKQKAILHCCDMQVTWGELQSYQGIFNDLKGRCGRLPLGPEPAQHTDGLG